MRCETKRGAFQCEKDHGHEGDCEVRAPSIPAGPIGVLADHARTIRMQAARIDILERALREIQTTPCESHVSASCMCCMFDRMIASNALRVLE